MNLSIHIKIKITKTNLNPEKKKRLFKTNLKLP